MKRKPTSRLHLAGTLLVLFLASVTVLSCGKDSALLEPSRTARGSGHPLGNVPAPPLGFVPTEAVLTLAPGASLNDYLQTHQVDVVSTLELPASGSTPATTYYLIRTRDGSQINLSTLAPEEGGTLSPNNRIDEGDRGGESFDDNHSWRAGGDYLNQPAITKVKIPQARAITQGLGEIVAILDTGIDPNHSLFVTAPNQANIVLAQNYTVFPPNANVLESRNNQEDDGDGMIDDGFGHGTHVAGIVYTGARKATLLIYKVLDDEGRGSAFGLAMAIRAAADYGAHVINLSLRLDAPDTEVQHAIEYAADLGIAVVASAGNRNTDEPQYPAAYDRVISVTSVDNNDVKAWFANFGSTVDISAPGVDIISPIPGYFGAGKYAIASGSSMATAFVSAAIALNDAQETYLGPLEAEGSVLNGAVDITGHNPGILLGSGRIDLYNSVHHPLQMP
jgi:thermitase